MAEGGEEAREDCGHAALLRLVGRRCPRPGAALEGSSARRPGRDGRRAQAGTGGGGHGGAQADGELGVGVDVHRHAQLGGDQLGDEGHAAGPPTSSTAWSCSGVTLACSIARCRVSIVRSRSGRTCSSSSERVMRTSPM